MHLTISNLTKTYPNGVTALKGISLQISTGMYGLVGPNGAGKSTLMRTLATLQEADGGSVRLDELDVLREKDMVRRLLGYLPQEFGLYPKLSAIDMLTHIAVLKGISGRSQRKELVASLLRQTNLYDVRKKKLGTFSGGMKQRFGIAAALIGTPKLIIVDEPTAGLDPSERHRFLNLLSTIGQNVIVILSTHIIDDVRELCTRMAIIDKGEVLLESSPQEAIDEIAGRMWKKSIDAAELTANSHNWQVVSSHLVSGKTQIRVYSDTAPDTTFTPTEATLEDVYFMKLNRTPVGSANSQAPLQ
jgi:ABC-type multidrug transport system ATPase subunit